MYFNVCIVIIVSIYLDRKISFRVFIEAECVWIGFFVRLLLVFVRILLNCFLGKFFKENVLIINILGMESYCLNKM